LEHHEQLRRFTSRNTFTHNAVIITLLFSFKLVSFNRISVIKWQNIN
jgi:hypothetical protein